MAHAQRRVYAPPEAVETVAFPRERVRRPPPQEEEVEMGGSRQPTILIGLILLVTVVYVMWTFTGGTEQGADAPVIPAETTDFKSRYDGPPIEEPATSEIDRALAGQAPEARAPAKARAVAEAPKAAPDPAPPTADGPPKVVADGAFLAQIASLKSADAADAAWTRFARRAPALFQPARKDVQQADLGERGVYFRVRAGYFATRADAAQFCGQVKALGQECLVVGR